MQRIGMIGTLVPKAGTGLYDAHWFAEGRSLGRNALSDLAIAIQNYHTGTGTLGDVEDKINFANPVLAMYMATTGLARKVPRAVMDRELAYAVDKLNESVVDSLRVTQGPGPFGRVHIVDGRLVFRRPGEATAKAAYNVKQSTTKAVTAVKSKFKKKDKDSATAGLGGDSGPLLFSLAGAGVGYAVSRKNRGMSAGVGALVGFLAARYFSAPATPDAAPATPGMGYVGAVADVVTEFSTTLADNGYSVSAPRESTVIVDDNRFDGSAVTVLHPPEKSSLVANLARAKASKYGINTQARGALQVKPTDGGSVVIFADV